MNKNERTHGDEMASMGELHPLMCVEEISRKHQASSSKQQAPAGLNLNTIKIYK